MMNFQKTETYEKNIVDTKLVKRRFVDAGITIDRVSKAFNLNYDLFARIIRNERKRIPIEYASVLSRLCEDPETFREEVLSIERGERVSGLIDDYLDQ